MSLVLLFSALLMAVAVWWLIKQTMNVQALGRAGLRSKTFTAGCASRPAAKIALWVFLAVVAVLFMLLVSRLWQRGWRTRTGVPRLR